MHNCQNKYPPPTPPKKKKFIWVINNASHVPEVFWIYHHHKSLSPSNPFSVCLLLLQLPVKLHDLLKHCFFSSSREKFTYSVELPTDMHC